MGLMSSIIFALFPEYSHQRVMQMRVNLISIAANGQSSFILPH